MSIVVTCDCTMEYRLPDRYAGKRCRCRECGGRIQVPRARSSKEEARAKRKKRKAKAAVEAKKATAEKPKKKKKRRSPRPARATTRRLGAQDRDILSDRRALRSSQHRLAPSESMHQLAPLLTRDRQSVGLTSGRRRKGTRPKRKASPKPERKPRKARKRERPSERKTERIGLARRGKAKAEPRKKPARRARSAGRRRSSREEDDAPASARAGRSTVTHALYAVVAIVGVLILGIGIVVGTGVTGSAGEQVSKGDSELGALHGLIKARQWRAAKAKADALEATFKARGDSQRLAQLYDVAVGVEKMSLIVEVQDDEEKLDHLIKYSEDSDRAVRLGIVWELSSIAAGLEPAQEALENLAYDSDPEVAEAAKQALVQAGGPYAIPFLADAIEKSAATGDKQGDVALERALELEDPSVTSVLVLALELRKKAPASLLKRVIERIGELGDPTALSAVEAYAEHEDAEVAAAAKSVATTLKP